MTYARPLVTETAPATATACCHIGGFIHDARRNPGYAIENIECYSLT